MIQVIRALYAKKVLVADMNIDLGGSQIDVTEQCLNVTDIGSIFIQMAGKAVAA